MSDSSNWGRWLQAREAQAVVDAFETAPERRDVRAWRREMLGGPSIVLSSSDVREWIGKFPFSPDAERLPVTVEVSPIESGLIPDSTTYYVQATRRSPILSLFTLAEALRAHYGWTAETAAGWVLTGGRPQLDAFRIEIEPAKPKPDQRWRTVRMTIPVEIPPSVVADQYRAEREAVTKGLPRVNKRPIESKSLEACLFAMRRNDGRSWGEVFAEWEARRAVMPDPSIMAFDSLHDFAAAARASYRRLTGRKLAWKRGRGERIRSGGTGDE